MTQAAGGTVKTFAIIVVALVGLYLVWRWFTGASGTAGISSLLGGSGAGGVYLVAPTNGLSGYGSSGYYYAPNPTPIYSTYGGVGGGTILPVLSQNPGNIWSQPWVGPVANPVGPARIIPGPGQAQPQNWL